MAGGGGVSIGEDTLTAARAHARWEIDARTSYRLIVALFSAPDIGTLAAQSIAAAAIARRYGNGRLFGLLRPNDAAESFVLACNPSILAVVEADPEAPMTVPVDWFDNALFAPVKCPDPLWRDRMLTDPTLVLVPTMLGDDISLLSVVAEAAPVLKLPRDNEPNLFAAMESLGLDRERWFAALMVDDPTPYLPAICHVVEEQGGQVARIAPSPAPTLPAATGVHDLARAPFEVQVAALSRARYVVADGAGPSALASAFAVPCAVTNAVDATNRVWNPADVLLAKTVVGTDGTELGTAEAHRRGFLRPDAPAGSQRVDNAPEDLVAVARHMFEATADCTGWRIPPEDGPVTTLETVAFPLETLERPPVRFWD